LSLRSDCSANGLGCPHPRQRHSGVEVAERSLDLSDQRFDFNEVRTLFGKLVGVRYLYLPIPLAALALGDGALDWPAGKVSCGPGLVVDDLDGGGYTFSICAGSFFCLGGGEPG
jgi:hypothetical protein